MEQYELKTNNELIEEISQWGDGLMVFHSRDAERLIIENQKMMKALETLADAKNTHEGRFGHNELELVEHTAKECLKSIKQ